MPEQEVNDVVAWAETVPTGADDDEAVLDQALRLVADHHRALGATIGRDAAAPSLVELRRSPLGQDLLLLSRARRRPLPPSTVAAASERVRAVLLRPLAADDYAVPPWFRATAVGRLLAAAERAAHGPGELLTPDQAAARLGVAPWQISAWTADGTLPSVADETGRLLVPSAAVERRRLVALAVADPEPDDVLVSLRHRRAS